MNGWLLRWCSWNEEEREMLMCLHRDKCRDFQDHLNECFPEESGRKGRGKETKTQYHVVLEAFGNAIEWWRWWQWNQRESNKMGVQTTKGQLDLDDGLHQQCQWWIILGPLMSSIALFRYFYYPSPSLTTFLVLLQNLLGLPTKQTPNTLITIDNTPRCITGGLLSQITHGSA